MLTKKLNLRELFPLRARRNFAIVAALFAVCFLFNASGVYAATFVVNTTADTQDAAAGDTFCADAGGACSLRAAITEANALAGADIITLPAGTYTETLAVASDNVNAGGDFDITSDITINGAGAATTIVQANVAAGVATERVFHIRATAAATALTVVIDGLTVQNGRYAVGTFGAGLRIDQGTGHNVTLSNLIVTNNLNDTSGGGITVSGATNPTVNINNCTVSGNNAGSGTAGTSGNGGGIYLNVIASTINITNTTITGNTATSAVTGPPAINPAGAGYYSLATSVTFTNSTITNNTVTTATGSSFGGGAFVGGGTTTFTNTNINGNTARVTAGAGSTLGGGVAVFGGTVNILGNSTVNTNMSDGTGGTGGGRAGGIYNQQAILNFTGSTLNGNTASTTRAGIYTLASAAATTNITNSTISNNSAPQEGGGITNLSVGAGSAITTITGSAITGNMATIANGLAGGILNFNTSTGAATVNLNNSTVSGNSADFAGGIYNDGSASTINLAYSTVASNTAANTGGGLFQDTTAGGLTNLMSSIVADNTATTGPDIFGVITSQNYNHVENPADGTFVPGTGDVTGTDPGLTALALNGGTTLNHRPGAGSPVLDTIPNGINGCGTAPFDVDQRGVIRPTDSDNNMIAACEKGSVELLVPSAAGVSISGQVLDRTGIKASGIANAVVTLIDGNGNTRVMKTNSFGYYAFDDLEVGQTYTFFVSAKRYQFSPQTVSLTSAVTNQNFTPIEQRLAFSLMHVRSSTLTLNSERAVITL